MLRNLARALLISLPLAACTPTGAIQLPATSAILDDMPRVQNSTSAPCWQQEQIAAQNSYVDTIKGGKEVVYSAPCKTDKPKEAPAKVAAASRG